MAVNVIRKESSSVLLNLEGAKGGDDKPHPSIGYSLGPWGYQQELFPKSVDIDTVCVCERSCFSNSLATSLGCRGAYNRVHVIPCSTQ